jgi:uncharacterized YigZ family protein
MQENDKYLTISHNSEGIYKEKGSRFLSFAFPITSESEVKEHIKELKKKFYDARHHVYAFRLGADLKTYRCSDDGEPSNSSGPPVLGQIQSHGLTNVLIVVVRYFGGTKLGVSGLIHAYRLAAADAIANNSIIEKFEQDVFVIEFGYALMNEVMKVLKEDNPEQTNQIFGNSCSIKLAIRKRDGQQLRQKLAAIDGLAIKLETEV